LMGERDLSGGDGFELLKIVVGDFVGQLGIGEEEAELFLGEDAVLEGVGSGADFTGRSAGASGFLRVCPVGGDSRRGHGFRGTLVNHGNEDGVRIERRRVGWELSG